MSQRLHTCDKQTLTSTYTNAYLLEITQTEAETLMQREFENRVSIKRLHMEGMKQTL